MKLLFFFRRIFFPNRCVDVVVDLCGCCCGCCWCCREEGCQEISLHMEETRKAALIKQQWLVTKHLQQLWSLDKQRLFKAKVRQSDNLRQSYLDEKMRIFKRRGSELVDPQLTGLRFDQVWHISYFIRSRKQATSSHSLRDGTNPVFKKMGRKRQKLPTVMSFVRRRMRKCSKGGNVKI